MPPNLAAKRRSGKARLTMVEVPAAEIQKRVASSPMPLKAHAAFELALNVRIALSRASNALELRYTTRAQRGNSVCMRGVS